MHYFYLLQLRTAVIKFYIEMGLVECAWLRLLLFFYQKHLADNKLSELLQSQQNQLNLYHFNINDF